MVSDETMTALAARAIRSQRTADFEDSAGKLSALGAVSG